MDQKLATLEKRVTELEAFAREQMAESIALGITLQVVLSTAADVGAVKAAVAAQVVAWELGADLTSAAPQVPEAIRILVLPRLTALCDAF